MTVTALVVTVALRTGLTRMRKSVPLMVLVGEDDRLLETDPELKEVLDKKKEEIASQRAEINALRQRLTDSSEWEEWARGPWTALQGALP